jgi:hypothetical protein
MKRKKTSKVNRNYWTKNEEKVLLNEVNKSNFLCQGLRNAAQILGRSYDGCRTHFSVTMKLSKKKLNSVKEFEPDSTAPVKNKYEIKNPIPVTIKADNLTVTVTEHEIVISL